MAKVNKRLEPYIKKLEEWQRESVKITTEGTKATGNAVEEETSLIKKLEKKRKEVQETWKEDTKENLAKKNREIERIDEQIKHLNELGKVKKKVDSYSWLEKLCQSFTNGSFFRYRLLHFLNDRVGCLAG